MAYVNMRLIASYICSNYIANCFEWDVLAYCFKIFVGTGQGKISISRWLASYVWHST